MIIVAVIVGALAVMCLASLGFACYCCISRRRARRAAAAAFLANSPEQKRLDELAQKKVLPLS